MALTPLDPPASPRDTNRVASWTHTVVVLAIFAAFAIAGSIGRARVSGGQLAPAPRTNVVPLYLSLMAAEWGLVLYVLRGIKRRSTLTDLLGGRIFERRGLATDLLTATVLWGTWAGIEAAWTHWSGPIDAATVRPFLAHRPIEIILWVLLSLSAGFAEEVVYRGYLQRQFAALTRSVWLALVMQAIVFGASHGYQGLAACVRITVFGLLFGAAAIWLRRLRPGIIAHALTDIVAGLT